MWQAYMNEWVASSYGSQHGLLQVGHTSVQVVKLVSKDPEFPMQCRPLFQEVSQPPNHLTN